MGFIDQKKIFYGLSAFLGVLAIFYFGFEYLVSLSPFTISVILFAMFAGFLVSGLAVKQNSRSLAFLFSAGSYLVGLLYTMGRFSFNSDQILVSLIVSSAVFAAAGYVITNRLLEPDRKQVLYFLVSLFLIVGGLIVYDTVSGDVSYSYDIVDEAELTETMEIGEVVTEKDSFLPYYNEQFTLNGCFYNETGDIQRGVSGFSTETETMNFGHMAETENIELELTLSSLDTNLSSVDIEVQEDGNRYRCDRTVDNGGKMVVKPDSGSHELVLDRQE